MSESWEAFCASPGPMVVGAVQGASCFGPAYEYALTAVTDLRRRKIRDRVPMTFVTSEPYIGHLGLGGVGDTKSMLESVLRDRDIIQPQGRKVWAFMGDGAFCMNPGMLMVERDLALPNVTHLLVSNRAYGATSNAPLPNRAANDYAAVARGMGLQRVFTFRSLEEMERGFDEAFPKVSPGHTFIVLEVEPFTDAEQKLEQPPFDGPELKYRFGREIERQTGTRVFEYQL